MIHYTYMIKSSSGKYYVGRHSTSNIQDGYMGSGVWVKKCRSTGTDLSKDILQTFEHQEEAKKAEQQLLNDHFGKPLCMNFSNRSTGFATGKHNPAHTPEERKRRSEENWTKTERGRKWKSDHNFSRTEDGKVSRSATQKANWQNPEYRKRRSGDQHWTITSDKHKKRMKSNNPMFDPEVRKAHSDQKRGKKRQMQTCPHCAKIGGPGNMSRWHFDNCKSAVNHP